MPPLERMGHERFLCNVIGKRLERKPNENGAAGANEHRPADAERSTEKTITIVCLID